MTIHPWLRGATLALAVAVCAGAAGAAEPAANPTAKPPAGEAKAKPTAPRKGKKETPPPKPALNGLAQAATNVGVVNCVGRIQQVTDFLTANTKSGAYLFTAPKEPNRHLVSTSLEIRSGAISSYASASFAPVGSSGCGALYETVVYWGNTCDEVAKGAFTGFAPGGKLGDTVNMLEGGPSLRVFLMPAGQGCLSIKKEVIY